MAKRLRALLCALALSTGSAGLAQSGTAAPLRVVTLSTILTEIARQVGDRDVSVSGLLRPGADPHAFEPAPRDLRNVSEADLILAGGLGLETYLTRVAANSGTRARLVLVGDALAGSMVFHRAGGRKEADPHWWNSIIATEAVVRMVQEQFSLLRPSHREGFSQRASRFLAQLDQLDRWARTTLAAVPPGRRVLVTTHDAFGWFARDYGFRIVSLTGLSPDAEPNARDLARTIDTINASGIPTLFVESSSNPRLIRAVAAETHCRLGGTLYADGLSPAAEGATYEAMFRHNVEAIAAGLAP